MKYYIKRRESDAWRQVEDMFNGLHILNLDGIHGVGESMNVYHEQWIDSESEDFIVTNQIGGEDVVYRANADVKMTFIIASKYQTQQSMNISEVHSSFVNYVCKGGDFYIKSEYNGLSIHVASFAEYAPTSMRLNRGTNSYILGTMTLHLLDEADTIA
jgi:hypothetical protein